MAIQQRAAVQTSSAVVYDYQCFGYLMKRQRGRRLKDGRDRRALKFEKRFCILKSKAFTYTATETSNVAPRQTFPVKRIKFIKDVIKDTFCDEEINYSLCFQFGDEKEALYFLAKDVDEKKKWMSKLKQAAEENGNQELETYHKGAYGSRQPDEWSCCKHKGKDQTGCTYTANNKPVLELVHLSSAISRPNSSSGEPSDPDYIMEERLERQASPSIPVPGDQLHRTRGDSGLGVSKTPFSTYTPRSCGSFDIMESCHKMVQSLRLSSDCIINFSGKWLLTGKRDGMVLMWEVTPKGIELASQSQPCFEVAGQVTSIDTHGEYAAVGSTVVQLVNLTDLALNKRILFHKSMKSMGNSDKKHTLAFLGRIGKLVTAQLHGNTVDIWHISSHKTLISDPFATCQLSDSTKIWSLSASTEGSRPLISVVCLEGSEVTLKILELDSSTCQIMHTSDPLKSSTPEVTRHTFLLNGRTIALAEGHELKLFDITHATTSDKLLQFRKASYTHVSSISCLNCSNELLGVGLEDGGVIVYQCNFDKQYLKCLEQRYTVSNDLSSKSGPVVSVSFLELNGMWCAAHKNGTINTWKAIESTRNHRITKEVQQKSAIGMELYAREVFTKPRIVKPKKNESVDIGCGISILLPQELIDNEIPVEVAFTPHGPCPTKLLGLPDGILVVSPILWVCAPQEKHFKEAATIKLPHCVDCKTQEDSDHLTILKADHNDISLDEAGQLVVEFKKIDAQFPLSQQYSIITDNHFCLYCTAINQFTDSEALQSVNYCLSILKPLHFSTSEVQKIHCILHYDLKGCHQLVDEQTPDGYELIQKKQLQFTAGRYKAAMKIQVDTTDASNAGWRISLQSEYEILLENVNFNNYRKPDILGDSCKITANKSLLYPHTYPPRFILEVSAREARNSQYMTLKFTGPKNPTTVTFQLQVHSTLHGLFKRIEEGGSLIQQKFTQYFKTLMEIPHETEV